MILYPAGAPLPSSKIILIILDGNMSDGIVPEYLENKSLSKSFVRVISLNFNKFSTMENLSTYTNLGVGKSAVISIANFCIETISVAGVAGIRTANIVTNFKKIIAVTLTPYITQGQNDPSLMTQVAHNSYNYVLENKKINIYATGSQTIEVTIFGLV